MSMEEKNELLDVKPEPSKEDDENNISNVNIPLDDHNTKSGVNAQNSEVVSVTNNRNPAIEGIDKEIMESTNHEENDMMNNKEPKVKDEKNIIIEDIDLKSEDHPEPLSADHPETSSADHSEPLIADHSEPLSADHPETSTPNHPQNVDADHPETSTADHSEPLNADHPETSSADHSEPLIADHSEPLSADHSEPLTPNHPQNVDADHSETLSDHDTINNSTTNRSESRISDEEKIPKEISLIRENSDNSTKKTASTEETYTPDSLNANLSKPSNIETRSEFESKDNNSNIDFNPEHDAHVSKVSVEKNSNNNEKNKIEEEKNISFDSVEKMDEQSETTSVQTTNQNSDFQVTNQNADIQVTNQNADVRVTNQNADVQVTNQNADVQVTNQNADGQVTNQNADVQVTNKNADAQVTNQNADVQVTNQNADVQATNQNADVQVTNQNADVQVTNQNVDNNDIQTDSSNVTTETNNNIMKVESEEDLNNNLILERRSKSLLLESKKRLQVKRFLTDPVLKHSIKVTFDEKVQEKINDCSSSTYEKERSFSSNRNIGPNIVKDVNIEQQRTEDESSMNIFIPQPEVENKSKNVGNTDDNLGKVTTKSFRHNVKKENLVLERRSKSWMSESNKPLPVKRFLTDPVLKQSIKVTFDEKVQEQDSEINGTEKNDIEESGNEYQGDLLSEDISLKNDVENTINSERINTIENNNKVDTSLTDTLECSNPNQIKTPMATDELLSKIKSERKRLKRINKALKDRKYTWERNRDVDYGKYKIVHTDRPSHRSERDALINWAFAENKKPQKNRLFLPHVSKKYAKNSNSVNSQHFTNYSNLPRIDINKTALIITKSPCKHEKQTKRNVQSHVLSARTQISRDKMQGCDQHSNNGITNSVIGNFWSTSPEKPMKRKGKTRKNLSSTIYDPAIIKLSIRNCLVQNFAKIPVTENDMDKITENSLRQIKSEVKPYFPKKYVISCTITVYRNEKEYIDDISNEAKRKDKVSDYLYCNGRCYVLGVVYATLKA